MAGRWCRQALFCLFILTNLITTQACQSRHEKNKIIIFAAASLTDVLPQAISALKDSFPSTRFIYNFAASSVLARQIIAGAAPDIFISANRDWTDELIAQNLIDSSAVHKFLQNKLVIILPPQTAQSCSQPADLRKTGFKRIAMGDPTHVPAGKYAKAVLQRAGLWNELEKKIVSAMDTRAALLFVETSEVDAGFVYLTDAMTSKKVNTAFILPDSLQPEITYQIAEIKRQNSLNRKLLRLLLHADAVRQIFLKAGFCLPVGKQKFHKF